MIETKEITKVYRMGEVDVHALRGISFQVDQGDFVSIAGPSGSGKTTLMDILGCLSKPTSGSYKLEGEEVANLDKNQLAHIRNTRIGFVFQTFNLLARASAIENVELPLIYSALSRKERVRKGREMLEKVGLEDRARHRPNELSGGERQRVAIARALVNNPAIILADEPTGNLDTKTGDEILGVFGDLNRQGITIILVTHEKYVADQAERIIHLRDGLIVEEEIAVRGEQG